MYILKNIISLIFSVHTSKKCLKKWVELVAETKSPLPLPGILSEILWKDEYNNTFSKVILLKLKWFEPKLCCSCFLGALIFSLNVLVIERGYVGLWLWQ